jgi:lysophospholipid acyltransferase (LPLAT)-like uncharacterized protein
MARLRVLERLRDPRHDALLVRLLGRLGAWLVRLLSATWRVRVSGDDPFATGRPFVAGVWHESMIAAGGCFRDRAIAVPVSRSRDGELVDAVLHNLGFAESPRGSSSRGSASLLLQMIRRVRAGTVVGVLLDGPRGPARHAKPGALALASATGAPLVPVGFAARPARRFGSWDRTLLPLPFARVRCHYGPALSVPKRPAAERLEELRRELEQQLDRLNRDLERELCGTPLAAAEGAREPRS